MDRIQVARSPQSRQRKGDEGSATREDDGSEVDAFRRQAHVLRGFKILVDAYRAAQILLCEKDLRPASIIKLHPHPLKKRQVTTLAHENHQRMRLSENTTRESELYADVNENTSRFIRHTAHIELTSQKPFLEEHPEKV